MTRDQLVEEYQRKRPENINDLKFVFEVKHESKNEK